MNIKTALTTVLFFTLLFANAQRKDDPTPEEISKARKLKEKYKDDDVVILSSDENINFSINNKTNKVVVTHGIEDELMNIEDRSDIVRYYFYDGETAINKFNIYYRTGRKGYFIIHDEAYNSQGIFHNDSRVQYVHLDFPVKGYKYKVKLKESIADIKYFTQVFFMDEFPVLKKKISIEVPKWLDIELKEINFEGYNITKKVIPNSKNNATIYQYTINDIPARFKDDNAPGPTYIYPHILLLAKSFSLEGNKQLLFKDTKDLYTWYKSLVDQLKNENTKLKEKVEELTSNTSSDEQKIKNIFYWVQDNIRYIAFEDGIAGFKPAEADDVYTKRYGDCKGMANLTKQMLKEAGFDARLVWIGTKRIAYNYSTPSLSVDNHMICALIKDKDTLFLDGTEKYNPLGEYAYRIQGKEALIENGDSFILKKVPEKKAETNKEIVHYTFTLDNDDLKGTVSKKYNGESRTSLLYALNNLKKDKKEESVKRFLNKDNINLKVSNIKVSDIEDRDSPLQMTYDIVIKNAVSSFDGETYITLNLDNELSDFEFKKRNTSFLFPYKQDIESTTELKIPSGYSISYIPKGIALKTADFDITIAYKKEGNKIIYTKKILFNNAKIDKKDFDKWNAFNKTLDKIYNEQIVLKKA